MATLSNRVAVLLLGAALLPVTGTGHAQYMPFQGYVEMPQTLAPMIMGNLANENLRLLNERNGKGVKSARPTGKLTTAPGGTDGAATARSLAASYPAPQRKQIEATFTEALRSYRQIEAKFGIPGNDVAGAVAAFLAGNYMAYRDVDFPDRHFGTLVAQMRGVLAANPAFLRASPAEKRQAYEQMATLGTFMAMTRETVKRQPPEAGAVRHFRDAARANLEQFLKTDPDRLTIGEDGLVIR